MFGKNLMGENVILGAKYVEDKELFILETAAKYEDTPVFDPNVVPRGSTVHIGDGVWLRRCQECNDFVLSYGAPFLMEFAEHEANHGLQVVGYNVPLLP